MLNERALLKALGRDELQALATHFDLTVKDRRVKEQWVQALVRARGVALDAWLARLSVATLKWLCETFDVALEQKKKAAIVQALVQACTPKTPRATKKVSVKTAASAGKTSAQTAAPKKSKRAKPSVDKPSVAPKTIVHISDAPAGLERDSAAAAENEPRFKSWAELAARATPSTQLASAQLQPLQSMDASQGAKIICKACHSSLCLRKCQAQRCENQLFADAEARLCAECQFERNFISMDEFQVRLKAEARCPHCDAQLKVA